MPWINELWEMIDLRGILAGFVVTGIVKILIFLIKNSKTRKVINKTKINFKRTNNIQAKAHGEPYWEIINNYKDNDRFNIEFDTNGQDKSESNVYVVNEIISKRIGKDEYPAQIIKMIKMNKSQISIEKKKRLGIKALVIINGSVYYKAFLSEKSKRTVDITFESLLETKDCNGKNPVFNCLKRGWNKTIKEIDDESIHSICEIKPEDIKYGDLFADEKGIWLTAFIIFDETLERKIIKAFRPTVLTILMDNGSGNQNYQSDKEFSLKDLYDNKQYEVTDSCNYTLLMAYARIINKTLMG